MSFGIVLTVYNHKYFKKTINIYCEFIPQIIFMLSLFGYLCVLIIYKWLVEWPNDNPPGLLNTLINMFLSFGSVKPEDLLYEGQVGRKQLYYCLTQ
jgi:V-type H+-transporting ATPase subunit a